MTLPDERYRALLRAETFLLNLMDPKETPRIPKRIRQEARSILRHYPGNYYITELARRSPDIIAEEMEEVTKFMKKYEISKEEKHGA